MRRRLPWGSIGIGAGAAGALAVLWWLSARSSSSEAPSAPIVPESSAQATRRARWMPIFRAAAARYGVPLAWLLAIARKETGFANLRSAPGARDDELGGAWGPMQVTSETARTLGFHPSASLETRGRAILADPARGIELGARYVAELAAELGADLAAIAAAYNAGPGRVRSGHIPATTRSGYVPKVLAYANEYAQVS